MKTRTVNQPTKSRQPVSEPLPLSRRSTGGAVIGLLTTIYVLALILGFVIFRREGATPRGSEMSTFRAVFTAVNTLTLTGFQQTVPLTDYGHAWMAVLMVIGTLFTLILGGMALVRAAGMRYSDFQIVRATVGYYALAVFVGAALLAEPDRGVLASAFQAASAFGNFGLHIGILPAPTDWRTHLVLMPLAFLGGLGVPVLLDIIGAMLGHHRTTAHTRVVIVMAAVVYVIGLVACVPWDQINSSRSAATNLAVGSAMSLNTRTTGFALISISNLARVTQWLILCMMIVGAAPGGAAGGVKFTTLFNLTRGIHRSIRGQAAGHTFAIAAVWAAGYGLLILTVLLILLGIHPEMPADHLLFVCVSAVGTVGLSQNPITITGGGLIVLSIAMLVGRLAPLLVLWWCAAEPEPDAVAVG